MNNWNIWVRMAKVYILNVICIREYGESWCDATIQGKLMWNFLGKKSIPRSDKNHSHGDSSHYMIYHKGLWGYFPNY